MHSPLSVWIFSAVVIVRIVFHVVLTSTEIIRVSSMVNEKIVILIPFVFDFNSRVISARKTGKHVSLATL
jgi:hypothetical protein